VLLAAAGPGSLALGAAGALIAVTAAGDLFLTVFNYDGYTSLATLFHKGAWRVLRVVARPLPTEARHTFLSLGSAAMLPATVVLWLAVEVIAFAFMYEPGLAAGTFALQHAPPSLGTAFYLSGGAISSLTFGDVTPVGWLYRALVDLETVVGLATFTLALGYVVTTFGTLGALEQLHGLVERHAEDPERPSSILARHFRGGQPSDLPSYLQELGDALEDYDRGLRRYPVVYFVHTRRTSRSIPHVFASLGQLLSLLRWGLPADEPMTEDPFLAALLDGYAQTVERLRLSFVGPDPIGPPEPSEDWRERFRDVQRRARRAAGLPEESADSGEEDRFRDWLPFAHLKEVVLDRVADTLDYERPSITQKKRRRD
jgi:hypothetical protein